MKPRLFIGSSLESVNIAYALQQNLHHSAEVTVWNQGVFQLSITAVESLVNVLDTCDFGMFVFSPDDVIKIRGTEEPAVRDNAVFELGLFVGRLGRERSFILIPDNVKDLHIPTDLIGMTPAVYEAGRSDSNLQAGTAPACHTISETMKRAGPRPGRSEPPNLGAESEMSGEEEWSVQKEAASEWGWLRAFIQKDYAKASEILTERMAETQNEKELAKLDSWLGRVKYSIDAKDGAQYLEAVITKYPNSDDPYFHLANSHIGRHLLPEALEVLERGLQKVEEKSSLLRTKGRCLLEMGRESEAETTLRQGIEESPEDPLLYLALADHFSDRGDNEQFSFVLRDAYAQLPNDESILSRYASHLAESDDKKLALVPYGKLVELNPEDPSYLSLRANLFLELNLNDLAMRDYKKANEIAKGQQGWILGNIGNLLKNRGFYRDGIEYLKKAIDLEPESEYAHGRLAIAFKLRDEEGKVLEGMLKEARQQMIAFTLAEKEDNSAPSEA